MIQSILTDLRALDTGRKALRSFGLVVGAVLLALALLVTWRQGWAPGTAAYTLAGIGAALVLLGLVAPPVLRPLYRVWMALAFVLGFVMTRVLLTTVFALVVIPTGLLLRLAGRDPLQRKRDPNARTYWIRKEPTDTSPERLEKYY